MHKIRHLGPRAPRGRGGPFSLVALCALIILAPTIAGCSPQSMAQGATATAQAAASPTAATPPGSTPTPGIAATPDASITPGATITATVTEGTPTPRPTPTGAPPPPLDRLNAFEYFPSTATLVKRDLLRLDATDPDEVLLTISAPLDVITDPYESAIAVLSYDTVYREWNRIWASEDITGTASPLPGANRAGGVNGGDLLRTGAPILLLRTTTQDNRAHLAMWRWDAGKKTAEALKMVPAGGGVEKDALFDADLDVNVADLNDDGVYEVVADNVANVQIWRWDGAKYVPEGGSR